MRTRASASLLVVAALGCGSQQVRDQQADVAEQVARNQTDSRMPPAVQTGGTELNSAGVQLPPRRVYLGTDTLTNRGFAGGPGQPRLPGDSPWQPRVIAIDLSAQGMPLQLDVPEGADIRGEFGAVSILHGPRFALQVRAAPVDIAGRRKEIDADGIQRVRRYVIAQPDLLFYEVESAAGGVGTSEYHFVANFSAGGKSYACEDVKGPAYTQAEAQAMLDTCRSAKLR